MAYKLPCQRHLQECVHKWYSRIIILIHLIVLEEISALFGTHTWLYTESADRSINILFPWTKWSQIPSCLHRPRIGLLCSHRSPTFNTWKKTKLTVLFKRVYSDGTGGRDDVGDAASTSSWSQSHNSTRPLKRGLNDTRRYRADYSIYSKRVSTH